MKIKTILLIIVQTLFFTALSAQTTQEAADEIVLNRMSQESRFYVIAAKEDVQPEMTITTSAGEELELDYPCWVYYVSYADVNCCVGRYLIVNESNGNLLEVDAKSGAEPENLAEWREVYCHNVPNYPYNIGSKWTYSVYDSILRLGYTETVEITGTTQLNNGMSAKVFKSTFSCNKDSVAYSYLVENPDTLTFLIFNEYSVEPLTAYFIDRIYVYPIEVGSQWDSQLVDDSYKVVSIENTIVPAGNFNTFKIIRQIKEPNYYLTETEWYSPFIGMIKREKKGWSFAYANKSYQLISFQLK